MLELEIGMKKWKKSELGAYTELVDSEANKKKIKSKLKNNIKKKVGMWEKGEDGTYNIETEDTHTINEDLAVWFGTKKKPKGSILYPPSNLKTLVVKVRLSVVVVPEALSISPKLLSKTILPK